MKGKDLWAQYQHYTRDLTEHGRKLGFAGVAICWVFKKDDFTFPRLIYAALLCFILYFITDILQAFRGAMAVKYFTEGQEDKLWKETGSIEGEIDKPLAVDRAAFLFFKIKIYVILAAFGCIGMYLGMKLLKY